MNPRQAALARVGGTGLAAQADVMLDVARPETRTYIRSHPGRLGWGVVDVILAIVMLPFAIWMWLIEEMVSAIARLQPS